MTFYKTIATHYDRIFPPNPLQIDFLIRQLPPAAHILDMGCATASLALALASAGHHVTGIDVSDALLAEAQCKVSQSQRSNVILKELDMRRIQSDFHPNSLDAITCMGNTLSHVSPADALNIFRQSRQLLKSNGLLIFQIINYDRLLKLGLSRLPTIDNEWIRFERTYHQFNGDSPFTFKTVLTVKGEHPSLTAKEILYPLRQAQLTALLGQAGFSTIAFYGNYQGAPAGDAHMPLIVLAQLQGK